MKNNSTTLIIFAREPVEGKVKTRLMKNLPASDVCRLYEAFVKDVCHLALRINCKKRILFYAGSSRSIPFLRRYQKQFFLKRQKGKDLGLRMHRAFERSFKDQSEKTVIIGTDCLTMTEKDIEKAFAKLSTHDCVLGPSKDGGYYLIGLKNSLKEVFQGIEWGGPHVTESTLKKIKSLEKSVFLLKKREDIDTISQLYKFAKKLENLDANPYTKKILKSINKNSFKRPKLVYGKANTRCSYR